VGFICYVMLCMVMGNGLGLWVMGYGLYYLYYYTLILLYVFVTNQGAELLMDPINIHTYTYIYIKYIHKYI
jgi:hypothetical protein